MSRHNKLKRRLRARERARERAGHQLTELDRLLLLKHGKRLLARLTKERRSERA